MYVQVKELMPNRADSVHEIAYTMFGRGSIFVICTVLFLHCLGALILFYMMIGDTISELIKAQVLSEKSDDDS